VAPDGLRVALIAGTLGQGGAEKQLVYMARALPRAGVSVTVRCLASGEHHERELLERGFDVRPVAPGGSRAARLAALVRGLARERPHVVQGAHTYVNLYAALAGGAAPGGAGGAPPRARALPPPGEKK
jgi:hypothetical protein